MTDADVAFEQRPEAPGILVPRAGSDAPAPGDPADLPRWVDRGVLVYGARKAGTTLLQNLLDGSDQLLVYPAELKLKRFVRRPERASDATAYHAESRIPAVCPPRLSQERYCALWRAAYGRHAFRGLADLARYDAWAVLASASGGPGQPEMWCAKEVGGPTMRVLDAWRAAFPQGRIVLLTRDPRMVTRAVLNDRRRRGHRLSWRQIARETLDPMRTVTAQARLLGEQGILVIAYEDLVADTAGVMATVARFLGLAYTPRFTEPSIFSAPVVVSTASRRTTEVFQASESWDDGLTRREKAVVATVHAVASLLPGYNVDYCALRRRLRRSRPEPAGAECPGPEFTCRRPPTGTCRAPSSG